MLIKVHRLTVDFKGSNITTGPLDFFLSPEWKAFDDEPSSYGSIDMGAAEACAGDAAIIHSIKNELQYGLPNGP